MEKPILDTLFSSPLRVRILRVFLREPKKYYFLRELSERLREKSKVAGKEVVKLRKIGFLKEGRRKLAGKKLVRKAFIVNSVFPAVKELQALFLKPELISTDFIQQQIKTLGKMKLAILTGVFVNQDSGRIDLLLVGDKIKNRRLTAFIRNLEREVGKEIDYVVMSPVDFLYRQEMSDRFIKNILEGKHKKLINKLGV